MIIKALLKEDTSILKGFAILCILMHNYFHWMEPIANMENEFEFNDENVFKFLSAFAEYPMESINILLSYLGHYGVQLFIFISGYGLAASMLNTYKGYKSFIVTIVMAWLSYETYEKFFLNLKTRFER